LSVTNVDLFFVFHVVQVSRVVQTLYGSSFADDGENIVREPVLGVWASDPAYLNLALQLFHATGMTALCYFYVW
jgi:hypothetical protein